MAGPITITDGGYCEQTVNEQKTYEFDFSTLNLPAGVELQTVGVFVITPSGVTQDNQVLVAGNRKTHVRLACTTPGKYIIKNIVTTNESPTQTKDKRFTLGVKA